MSTCKFTPIQYTPDKDKVVSNVQVQATPPVIVWGENAGVASDGAITTGVCGFLLWLFAATLTVQLRLINTFIGQ